MRTVLSHNGALHRAQIAGHAEGSDSDWKDPADLQENQLAGDYKRRRYISIVLQITAGLTAAVRFRNARAKRGACTTNEKVVTSSHGLATAPASCIAKSDLEKLSSVTPA